MTEKTRDGSAANDHWGTPKCLYDELDAEFRFDFDPCPLHATFDGLMCEWGEVNFVNPPYNKTDKPKFIQRAVDMQARGKTSVLLIPAATSTHQFHDLIVPNAEVRFLRGRVKFVGADGTSSKAGKHDSMVCVFKGKKK